MSETWTKETCPHCGFTNWLNHGDMQDLTEVDIDACECWSCEKKFLLPGYEEVYFVGEDEDYKTWEEFLENEAHCERGRKTLMKVYKQ